MSQDYLDKLIEKDKAGTQIQSIPLHDTELRGITIDDPITVEGNPINFSTKNEQNAIQTMVDLEPIQNLHGYSKPWVGGAGKNLLPLDVATIKSVNTGGTWSGNVYTLNTAIFTLVTDSDNNVVAIKVKGSAPSGTHLTLNIYSDLLISSATIISSGHGGENTPYVLEAYRNDGTKDYFYSDKSGYIPNIPANVNLNRVRLVLLASQTISGEATIYPMIRLSTVTDATFEPYTNICQILPHEEIKIEGYGKNLCKYLESGIINNTTGQEQTSTTANRTSYIDVLPSEYYTLSGFTGTNVSIRIHYFYKDGSYKGNVLISNINGSTIQQMPNDVYYIRFQADNSIMSLTSNIQVEKGQTATSYLPYSISNQLTLPLPEDIYSGTLNLETGEMVVSHKIVDLGDFNWYLGGSGTFYDTDAISDLKLRCYNTTISSRYPVYEVGYCENNNVVAVSMSDTLKLRVYRTGYASAAEAKYKLAGCQVVYELADSYKYILQLTPAQLKLFKDVNNLNSSDYTTLTVTYHSNSIATLTPATDTTDGLLSAMDQHKLNTYNIADIGSDDGVTIEDNPLMITTHSDQHALSTKVNLAPIQDLHGFTKPWVGGAGKNLLPMTVDELKTLNNAGTWNGNTFTPTGQNITYTIMTDSDNNVTGIKVNGTNGNVTYVFSLAIYDFGENNFNTYNQPSASYIASSGYNDDSASSYGIQYQANITATYIRIAANYSFSNKIFYPMIRLSTESNPTFEPYTNICSISGLDEIDILGCGKNIWDGELENGYIYNGNYYDSTSYKRSKNFIRVIAGETYRLTNITTDGQVPCYDKNKVYKNNIPIATNGQSYFIFTIPNNIEYIKFYNPNASFDNNVAILHPSDTETYEPYQESNNLSISLPETVCSGELDLESGELRVDRTDKINLGNLTWTMYSSDSTAYFDAAHNLSNIKNYGYGTCDCYELSQASTVDGMKNGQIRFNYNKFYIRDLTKSSATELQNSLSGKYATCELATPITIHLTPSQLTLFKDINHISTNAKSISVTYREGKLAINSPATDTKDGLLSAIDKRALDRTEEIVEGNPIQFETESVQVVKSTIIDLEPIQDLHGFTKPWVGGAGKNILPLTVDAIKSANTSGSWSGNAYTLNNVVFTILTDSDNNIIGINVNGTANAITTLDITFNNMSFAQDTILSGCPSGGSDSTYKARLWNGGTALVTDTGSSATLTSNTIINKFDIRVASGAQVTNKVFYPMLRLFTVTDATFEPYTNIASISGRSEVDILGCGKNLISGYQANRCVNGSGQIASDGATCISNYIRLKDNVDYTLAYTKSASSVVAHCFDEYGNYLSYVALGTTNPVTFSTNNLKNGTKNIYIQWNEAGGGSILPTNGQLEISSSATNYSPYTKSNDITISLGQTVYGGQLDVEKGELVVDRGYVDMGSLTWIVSPTVTANKNRFYSSNLANVIKKPSTATDIPNILCSELPAVDTNATYNNIQGIGVHYSYGNILVYEERYISYTAEQFKTAMDGVDFVYELATPTTISLTPEQVKLLQGVNTITTNADNITLTYRNGSVATLNDLESLYAKLKAYIDSLHAT